MMKVRRVANSNVLTLPRELEALGYTVGTEVSLIPLKNGVVLLVRAEQAADIERKVALRLLTEEDE